MKNDRIAVLAGDFYHKPESMMETLRAVSADLSLKLTAFIDPEKLPWDSLGEFGVLVVAREGRLEPQESNAVWQTERRERAMEAFVNAGGGLAALHAGLASYDHAAPYGRTTRGIFLFHPSEHPEFRVRLLGAPHPQGAPQLQGAPHPLLRDFSELTLRDEMYFVRVDSARTARLLEVYSPDYGTSTAAWAHEQGAGRVFCFTPGHTDEVLADPGYRRFLRLGIQWIAERL